ncbi:MAG: hypothetical protein IJ412_01660 [Oscillospiraceae bacterium]|nr:hypothetical protein [Oscillospiraceae bacterium]
MDFRFEKITSSPARMAVPDQLWCWGCSTIVRRGEDLFVTHTRLIESRPGLTSTCLELFAKRGGGEWEREFVDEGRFQREPCPITLLGEGLLGVTVNPCDETEPADPNAGGSIASTPQLYIFDIKGPARLVRCVTLRWDDPAYRFAEHSYRSSAVDTVTGDLLFTNGHYPPGSEGEHCYTLLDKDYFTVRSGPLEFSDRSCYHNICMRGGEVYLFGLKDIIETRKDWMDYKQQMTGNRFDYALRTVHLLYSPDLRSAGFAPQKVAVHREDTCGRIFNHDCAYDENGDVLFVYSAVNVQMDFMRDKFFPGEKLEKTLEVLRLRGGEVIERTVIDRSTECDGANPDTEYGAALHTMADGSLRLLWSKQYAPAQDAVQDGLYVCSPRGGQLRKITDRAIGVFFASRSRLGAAPSDTADLVWIEKNRDQKELNYAYMHGIPIEGLELVYMHGQVKL